MSKQTLILIVCMLLLVACGEETPTPTIALTLAPSRTPTATLTATATATPVPATSTPSPTPEPDIPGLTVTDQTLTENGVLHLAQGHAGVDGWVALLDESDALLGYAPVIAGDNDDVAITVEPLRVGSHVTAALFADAGSGAFTLESATPVINAGDPVSAEFDVTLEITMPLVVVADQTVDETGVITIDTVIARSDGWIAIYNDADGELGDRVGLLFVYAGVTNKLTFPILWRTATPLLHVVLHEDTGRLGRFDYPDTDPIVTVRNAPVESTLTASFPPDIYVLDQPVIDGHIVVERVLINEPGWLVVSFANDDGTPGNVIGYTALEAGVNEQVVVETVPGAATETLFLRLHRDTATQGVFEYPADDPAIDYQGQVRFFTMNALPGNYVISMDQPLAVGSGQATVDVPLVVGDIPMWVVVRADNEGELGDVLGYLWVPAGINRDLVIPVDAENVTPLLHVVLHIDRDTLQLFEFPDGRDFELQRRFAPIDAPFLVLDEDA